MYFMAYSSFAVRTVVFWLEAIHMSREKKLYTHHELMIAMLWANHALSTEEPEVIELLAGMTKDDREQMLEFREA